MAKREIKAGATDQTVDVFIQDSSSTTGAGLTGLVFNSSGLVCYYRKGATGSATALTLATQTVGGAHSDGGFVEISSSNMPGMYRLDFSDTMVASAGMLSVLLKGATNMAPCPLEVEVVSVDKFDTVRLGLTALPNAAAEAAGGLYTRGTGAGQINQDGNGRVDTNTAAVSGDTDAADRLEAMFEGCLAVGTVNAVTTNADFTLTSTDLTTNDDDYNNMLLVFRTGNNKFIPRAIQDYTGSTKQVVFTGSGIKGAYPRTVSAGDAWFLIGAFQ